MNLKQIVQDLFQNYKANKQTIQEREVLEEELLSFSGIERNDSYFFVLIPVDSPDLQHFGSACGEFGNKMFSSKSLATFLKNKDVKNILGIVYQPHSDFTYSNNTVALSAIALPIVGKDGHVFQFLAEKNKGSFRYERSRVKVWSVYESE
ncbi:hypothetical protein HZA97_01745 [Candidatus Woesearchaeota archaeon]|nr:hypothetical protein [Candidatus Woesearchaeota archaeon]